MIFAETPLKGAYLIDVDKKSDTRGFFARTFCLREFQDHSLETNIVQINTAMSVRSGTLRGMHYQLTPKAETKVVRCIRGAVYDVILDIRRDSPTFGRWFAVELNCENHRMMYIPKGFAHGYLTLEDNTELLYLTTEFYSPDLERTIRWNDPKFGIKWPAELTVISDKDRNQGDFDPAYHLGTQVEAQE